MTNIILCGANGKIGKVISSGVKVRDNCKIVAGVDLYTEALSGYPVYSSFDKVTEKADVIIDFSNPALLDSLLDFARKNKLPVVIATTGYSSEQIEKIKLASKNIPVFFSFNMSLGVNLLVALSKKAASILGDRFDVEIIEKHHNLKVDAPSGTAIMLANAVNEAMNDKMMFTYDRHSKREKRAKNEVGIHSVRGGTIVGEHDVIFAGHDEVITLSHHAASKEVFAEGAVKAALFLANKTAGLYDMNDIVKF